MADPTPYTHTAQMARRTLGDMRTFCAQTVRGMTYEALPAHEKSQVDAGINQEVEEWRAEFTGLSGFGEQEQTLDWPQGNTKIELPADWGELLPGGRAVLLDSSGAEIDKLEIATKEAWEADLDYGLHPKYDNRLTPIGFIWRMSDNKRRMLEIKPTPTNAVKVRVYYYGIAQALVNTADELEAPLGMHTGIETGAASRFALFVNSEKWQSLRAEAERSKQAFRLPTRDERKRPARLLSFHEAGGYEAFEFPDKQTFTR